MLETRFEWDPEKDTANQAKRRVIASDQSHSSTEQRFYRFGAVGDGIATVRFTYRAGVIRIIGAGYWRKGKAIYDSENQVSS